MHTGMSVMVSVMAKYIRKLLGSSVHVYLAMALPHVRTECPPLGIRAACQSTLPSRLEYREHLRVGL